ncbi:MAG TPA: carboxypeptidase-like regulatory domain-containing protein, partial [Terriglobales bacterium]
MIALFKNDAPRQHQESAILMHRCIPFRISLLAFSLILLVTGALAQGTSGSLNGIVTDPTGAVAPGATVQIENPVSGYSRTAKTNAKG